MRFKFWMILLLLLSAFSHAQANPPQCLIKLRKAACWANYTVTFNIAVAKPGYVGDSITASLKPKVMSLDQNVACDPENIIHISAYYSPAIWSSEKNKLYSAAQVWTVASKLDPKAQWQLPVCFADDFISVDMPIDANGSCQCQTQKGKK